MKDGDLKRISRLIAIVTQLQTRRILTATQLSEQFKVSIRTIYRDIRVLEDAGIPILMEDGKGYSLMQGFNIPPVMFSENEASALVTAEQLLLMNSDRSFTTELIDALNKVKAVLKWSTKDKLELLSKRIALSPMLGPTHQSNTLVLIQHALTEFKVLDIGYISLHKDEKTSRSIEPFALYYCQEESWALISYCRLRKDFRIFKLDRIFEIKMTQLNFEPHKITLKEYLKEKEKNFTTPDTLLS